MLASYSGKRVHGLISKEEKCGICLQLKCNKYKSASRVRSLHSELLQCVFNIVRPVLSPSTGGVLYNADAGHLVCMESHGQMHLLEALNWMLQQESARTCGRRRNIYRCDHAGCTQDYIIKRHRKFIGARPSKWMR